MKLLPTDISTFSLLREEGYVYVDKTEHIYNLITHGRYYFLARPRRFGKSLLISTLEEIFSGNKELFSGLAISTKSDFAWEQHPIVHIDFSRIQGSSAQDLKTYLKWKIGDIGQSYGIDVSDSPSLGVKFEMLIAKLATQNRVVVLIDEYDHPILQSLNSTSDNGEYHEKREVLKGLFSALKSLDKYIKFLFVTGISKFSKTSIFSGGNNIKDVSELDSTATLLGYTKQEIESNFSQHIDAFVSASGRTKKSIMSEMKKWYDGYRFTDRKVALYNPYSVMNYLTDRKRRNYWFASGTPTFLIRILQYKYHEFQKDLDKKLPLAADDFSSFEIEHIPPMTLLYQTGYLTIKKYNQKKQRYTLDYPNDEVRLSLKKCILTAQTYKSSDSVSITLNSLYDALEHNRVDVC